ncbi:hypothetical protein BCR43DRAFT_468658 [Syncephalastrum racemosum]|uniref:RRM domain-containing protein n=1 Tax=Syncephalastrum racemosum TaxID=13706 RepID=A0A1X2HMF2_SYNRA|nr:hypothetical protein BCR43DRAFT_468658 [Syncephalastrum racemosum]
MSVRAFLACRQRVALPSLARLASTPTSMNINVGTAHIQRRAFSAALPLCNDQSNLKETAQAISEKFVGQIKKERRFESNRKRTRLVQIQSLPSSATHEDIRKLAREAFDNGDKTIEELVFRRSEAFDFRGRAMVLFKSSEDAKRFIEYANRRVVGGNIIKADFTGSDKQERQMLDQSRPPHLMSVTDTTSAAGRSVIFTGFPSLTKPDHLLGFLRSRSFFPADGTVDSVVQLKPRPMATVSKFLVKFDSESEAWRCVRGIHNTDFLLRSRNQKFRISATVAY